LTIDLGSHHVVCAVGTQGCNIADRWVKSYHISISSNGILWSLYKESNVTRIFYGNHDRSTISHQLLYHSPTARYVRIAPQTYHGLPCLRMEIYGYQLESTCSKHSVGVPSPLVVPKHRFNATSNDQYNRPYMARLQGYSSWKPLAASNQYLQIDLGKIFCICAVLTQGDPIHRHWVTKYSLRYSNDNKLWKKYKKLDGKEKVF
ncbi:retinoschisin-like, partial [Exaiptasia diaphana]|uniref:F5/8 type C domain-containing protein n=1 Tax=Exaiptasia diaphana TaxID=2652724 RepID=A0A913WNV1_EXADI